MAMRGWRQLLHGTQGRAAERGAGRGARSVALFREAPGSVSPPLVCPRSQAAGTSGCGAETVIPVWEAWSSRCCRRPLTDGWKAEASEPQAPSIMYIGRAIKHVPHEFPGRLASPETAQETSTVTLKLWHRALPVPVYGDSCNLSDRRVGRDAAPLPGFKYQDPLFF